MNVALPTGIDPPALVASLLRALFTRLAPDRGGPDVRRRRLTRPSRHGSLHAARGRGSRYLAPLGLISRLR